MTFDITSAVLVSIIALICTIAYNNKNSKKNDIEEAQERARLDERTNNKLDNIFDAIGNIQKTLLEIQGQLSEHGSELKSLRHKFNVLEKRVTTIENVIDLKVVGGNVDDE